MYTTLLDELPIDVIREHIIPYLNYEERINLNQCIPASERISRRMNKGSIEKHEQSVMVNTIRWYLEQIERGLEKNTKIKIITRLFTLLLKPRYFSLIERHQSFRLSVINKIRGLIHDLIKMRTPVEIGARVKLASELKKLRKKIDESGPYTEARTDSSPLLSFQ